MKKCIFKRNISVAAFYIVCMCDIYKKNADIIACICMILFIVYFIRLIFHYYIYCTILKIEHLCCPTNHTIIDSKSCSIAIIFYL